MSGTYEEIYAIIRQIPYGHVSTYGSVAKMCGNCTARMVGYALAASGPEHFLPWHRVINSQGMISQRRTGSDDRIQRQLLESEGIAFKQNGRIDLSVYGWPEF